MTNKQKIEALEKGIKSSVTPEPLKEKMRTQLAQLKALEKESTSDKKPKFKVGDVVVLKGETTLEKEITSYKKNSKGEFVYKAKYVSKPEATGEWNEEEIQIFVSEKKETPSNEDVLAILYNADSKGWNATKAESGGDIKASDELTEKYANAVSKALKGIKKGSLSEEIFDELTDGNNHLLNEFLVWNGYYDAKTTATNKASYQRIWDKGNRQVANPEIISLGAKKMKPSSATPIKKATRNYYRNKEIKSVTVLENGKKVTYAGKDVLNGANFFKEGGALVSKAKYVPVRNIVEVTFEDGSKDKPRNGYHIKNGATPIKNDSKSKSDLEKELHKLQRELNSSRLSTYIEGDNSKEAQDLKDERALKLKRFNDVLSELRELDSKFEFGGVVNYEKGKTYPVKKVSVAEGEKIGLDGFPNFHKSGSISGMKKQYYGKDALLIQSGNYIYNVTSEPEIYFRYEHGGPVELPEGSLQHFENYYLEKGGKVGRLPKYVMDFYENDYKKMVQDYPDYPFYSVQTGNIQEIFSEKTEELVAKWNSKKKELTVFNPKYNSEVIVWLKDNSFLTQDQVYEIDEMFEEEEYKLGGALLSAWKRERKYVNKSEDYEVRYAKGKNRKGYKKYAKGGEVGDYAKVPVGYNMTHYGLIKKVITNDVLYPENGYEIAGIGDVLHPEQFEIISSTEFNKLKKQGTEVKPNHFLIIEEEFEKGGVLSKGDEVKHQVTKKHGKVISVKELNGLEDEVVVEFEDGTTETLNSFDVEKVLEIKAKKTYDPNSGLTFEEWKAKHNIQNYGKGGPTEKGQGKGAIFAIAREIRKPGEKWQDAVARAGKLNK